MLEIGQQVRVLEPFTSGFPDVYTVEELYIHEGQTSYLITGGHMFDLTYLEVV